MQCAQQEIKDEGAADGLLGEIDIAECHICVVLKRRRDRIPRWRLLASSASALGRDPADEERLAGVDGGLDEVVEAGLGALVHLVEVALGVDAREERDRRDAEHRGSGSSDATLARLAQGVYFRTSARDSRQLLAARFSPAVQVCDGSKQSKQVKTN